MASYLGLAVTTGADHSDLRFTVLEQGAASEDVKTSLRILFRPDPTRPDADGCAAPTMTLFASHPGAFVDLAADLAWLTSNTPTGLILDEHMQIARGLDDAGSVARNSAVNQAVGALLARGHTPEQAHAELVRRAAAQDGTVEEAARQIVAELVAHAGNRQSHATDYGPATY